MKRLIPLLLLALMFATLTRGVVAQDASPAASDSLLAELGYPVITFSTDGQTITGPTELEAGRYLMQVDNTSESQFWEMSFFSPVEGESPAELVEDFAAVDPASEDPPAWWFDVVMAGGVTSPATEGVVEVSAGEWVVGLITFGDTGVTTATLPVSVAGELPDYPAIDGVIPVAIGDLSVSLPATIAAGPQLWEVTNTGEQQNFFSIMNAGGPVTQDEAVNGVKLFYGLADATPAAEGSPQNSMSWTDVAGTATISGGVTSLIEIDLAPGTYIAMGLSDSPAAPTSDQLTSMVQVFTVE